MIGLQAAIVFRGHLMTTRATSAEAYQEIKDSGLLSKRRFDVYEELYLGGPGTQTEVVHRLWAKIPGKKMVGQPSFTPRFAELERLGVIVETGERQCTITGKRCIEWETTTNLPVKLNGSKRREFWVVLGIHVNSLKVTPMTVFATEAEALAYKAKYVSAYVGCSELEVIRVVEARR